MRMNCGICFEFLTCNADVSAGPCGHILHTSCVKTWFESLGEAKKTCPTCRKSCPARDLRRLFFSSGETDENSSQDSNRLANQVDSLSFDLKCAKEEVKKIQKALEEDAKKVHLQRDEIRDLERCNRNLSEDLSDAKKHIEVLKAEKKRNDLLSKQISDMKNKLTMYETIEIAVNGSSEELALRLHQMGDYSQSAKEVNIISMELKKELKRKNDQESSMRKEIAQKNWIIKDEKSKLEKQSRELKLAQDTISSLSNGIKTLEDELESCRNTIRKLQEVIVSPSADKKTSALNRLLTEYPPPFDVTICEDKTESKASSKRNSMDDLFEMSCDQETIEPPTKKPFLISSQKSQSSNQLPRSTSGLSGLLSSISSSSYQCKPLQSGKFEGLSFNGMGGHGKPDEFPKPIKKNFNINPLPSSKPKGVSRPKNQLNVKPVKSIKEHFILQTP